MSDAGVAWDLLNENCKGINIKMVIKQLMTNLALEDGFGSFHSVIRA